MNKKTLVIMCGAPGSGKSTYVRNHIQPNEVYVSRDEIRFSMLGDNDEYFSKEKEVFKTFVAEIQKYLDFSDVTKVYCDATHISEASRDKLCDALRMDNVENILCLVVRPNLEETIMRNENRRGQKHVYVPRSVVRRMYFQFERPEEDTNYPKDVQYVEVPAEWEKFG